MDKSVEGIVFYRLFGSHPAAKGMFQQLGFPGQSTTVARVLERLVVQHKINTAKYRCDVTRSDRQNNNAPPDAAAAAAPSSSGGPSSSATLHGEDELHTYDSIVVTISTRKLSDEEVEKARAHKQGTTHSDLPGMMSMDGAQHAGPSASTSSSRSAAPRTDSDPRSLERLAAVANRVFPVHRGQRASSEAVTCSLCELPPFDGQSRPCCSFIVCQACLTSAQAMMPDAGNCPVCGRRTLRESSRSGSRERVRSKTDVGESLKSEIPSRRDRVNGVVDGHETPSLRSSTGLDGTPGRGSTSALGAEVEVELRQNLDQVLALLDARGSELVLPNGRHRGAEISARDSALLHPLNA